MSSDEEIDVGSGDDGVFPDIDDAPESDQEPEEIPDLEEGDRIDDDALVHDDVDELDVVVDEEEQKELEKVLKNVLISEIKDRNHKIIKIVPADERISSNRIQRPEMTEAIGIRASQIERGSPVFTDVTGYTDPILMARKEFVDRKNPLILERALHDTPTEAIVEHWVVRDMTFPITNREMMMISRTAGPIKPAKTTKTGRAETDASADLNGALVDEFRYV
jgi:DNA-directed RNA polymerase subunit K/omega